DFFAGFGSPFQQCAIAFAILQLVRHIVPLVRLVLTNIANLIGNAFQRSGQSLSIAVGLKGTCRVGNVFLIARDSLEELAALELAAARSRLGPYDRPAKERIPEVGLAPLDSFLAVVLASLLDEVQASGH